MLSKRLFFLLCLLITLANCSPIPKDESTSKDTTKDATPKTVQDSGKVVFSGKIVVEEDAPPPLDPQQFETTYYYALNYLYKNGDYERAIEVFKALIKQYPQNSLTDNCQFWIGVSYYNLGKYDKALMELEKVSLYNPDEIKTADAQKWMERAKKKLN